MSKAFWLSIALVAVFGFSSAQVMARGGGHGGGHHGGGHHGGGHHSHHSGHHSHHHSGYHTHHGFHHHYHHSNWAHHNRPFSRGWYGRHGGAWGYGWGGWGWGNPWAVSTFGATAAWLGLEGAEPIYGNYGTVDNVLTSETADEPAEDPANLENENEAAADEIRNDENDGEANNASQLTPDQIAAARQLAISGKLDPTKDTTFLPMGVFSIAPQGQAEASALVQLAVSKTGIVRGTYYDLLTDHDQPIRGAVDKKSQQVAFTFGDQGKVTFETSLGNLTQAKGGIVAHFENGKTSNWTLARYEHEPTDEKGNDNDADSDASDSDSDSDDASDDAPAASPQAEPAAQ